MTENDRKDCQNKTSENSDTESDPYKDWDDERMEDELQYHIETWTPEDQTPSDDAGIVDSENKSDDDQTERRVSQQISVDDL